MNARDRIGKGPWHNVQGVMIARDLAHLHGDTLELARLGNLITKNKALNEKGESVKGVDDGPLSVDASGRQRDARVHDMLTGSQPDGRAFSDGADHTCWNWTSAKEGSAQVGHHDRNGGGISWNSAHATRGCSQADLASSAGAGLFYCFAVSGQ